MFSGHYCYVLDANVIRKMSYDQILKMVSRKNVVTIYDVFYEVQDREKSKLLKAEHLDALMYEKMREIMNSTLNVRGIISYYENQGAADIALLAYCSTTNYNHLFTDEKIIVTDDKGLRTACEDFEIRWMSFLDFINIE